MDPLNQEFIHLLQKSGWNQTRAALELHVEPATVSRYVSGQTRPSMTILKLFGRLLGERLRYVADDPRAMHESQPVLEEWETKILLQIRALPPEARRKFVDGMSSLLEATRPPVVYRPPISSKATPEEVVESFWASKVEELERELKAAQGTQGKKSGATASPAPSGPK